jgi:hypothetical protein
MIEKCQFIDLNGESWLFNTADCPLHDWNVDYDVHSEGDEDQRMQEHGIWPTRTHVGKALIHLEGELLRDSTADYVQAARNMKRIIMPKDERQIERKLGDLILRFTGDSEDIKSKNGVTLDGSPQLPKTANFPTVGDYMVTFKAFSPFFVGVASGKSYLI